MPLSIEGIATGLDNGDGRLTKLFLKGTGFSKHDRVEIREKAGAGLWTGKIKRVYDGNLALVHVNTIEISTVNHDKKIIELDDDNVEIIVTNGTDTATEDGSLPIFP